MITQRKKSYQTIKSTLIFGFSWLLIGFFGSLIINPEASMGPVFGIFVTGPIGFLSGLIISSIANKIRHLNESRSLSEVNPFPKIWNWIIGASAGLAVIVIVSAYIYVPAYENKNSDIIREASDLEKRDSTMSFLRVRSLSDNDLYKLQSFKHLERLDFCSGFGVGDAKITDKGLKIISELNLPKLSSLNFCKCDKITDKGIEYLKRMQNLKVVVINECKNVSDSARAELIKKLTVN